MSEDAKRLENHDKKRASLLGKLRKCEISTEGGRYEAAAIVAELEENDAEAKALQIDMGIDWIATMGKGRKEALGQVVKAVPRSDRLMLSYESRRDNRWAIDRDNRWSSFGLTDSPKYRWPLLC